MTIVSMVLVALGGGLFVFVAAQSSLALVTAFRQFRTDREQRSLGLEMIKHKIEAMKALHREHDEAQKNTWIGFRKFKVKTKKEGGGITSAYLYPHDGKKLPPFKPGQYLTFQLRLPGEEKPLIRCYSLSDCYHEDYYRVSVKKVPPPRDKPELPPGKSSTYFNEVLKDEDILDVKAPSGNFFLEPQESFPVVLIGGGVGITPVFSMLRTLVKINSERETWLFYGVRNGKEQVYKEELKEIARTQPNVKVCVCYSGPGPEDKEGEDYQYGERVTADLFKRVLPSNNYDFYICGPPPMMQTLVPGLEEWGVPTRKINFEAFGPATVKKAKPKKAEGEGEAQAKVEATPVKFAQAGKELKWDGSADSILELAEEAGISMSSGCRVGNCGTCAVAVKSGQVEYPSEPSFDPEAGTCLACVGVPKGPVEIDA